ncbi:hypothetical protein BZA05DRAFT_381350 [Tricharina praecox]|uniref:uncharacterized protein n=1 Tax=Tricharina praecox TaxID=43433 RepID=UPI00221E9749|nr:uncharacterized protein BZA05DRAFT_381350 [Tricharina praecox]KAI5858477.1 hypothetical protein BZA05DRAFT_381350 [Tricharina praecox]
MPAAPPKAIIFVANHGNDPTEVAVPWSELKAGGCAVTFATEHGDIAAADPVTVQQTLFACVLGATSTATSTYRDMLASAEFNNPLSWSDEGFDILGYDIVILPGGHDKPIRQYLESKTLHRQLGRFLPYTQRSSSTTTTGAANTDTDTNNTNDHNDSSTTTTTQPQKKVLGAICHGVLPLAFAKCPGSREREGNTLLGEYRLQTTTLPKWMEATAWVASQAWLMGSYYRTYIERGAWTCGDVEQAGGILINGPMSTKPFVHIDPNHRYISARFPGDAVLWAQTILKEAREALGEW